MMKKNTILILLIITICSLGSCRKAHDNGDLDGQWQVLSIEYPDSTYVPDRMYYCFQQRVIQLRMVDPNIRNVSGYFEHLGDSIHFDIRTNPSPTVLYQYGLNGVISMFKVNELSSQKMVISNSERVIHLRKF